MRVPSPTRAVGILMASAAVVFGLASPVAAAPQAPGNFTGLGFDTCVAPSQSTMDAWNVSSPFAAVGIYISGNSRYCGDEYQPNLTPQWVARNAKAGWRFIPIHVGYQSPCFKNNPDSRVQKKRMSTSVSKARSQARSDAGETIRALRRLGFGPGSTSFLDLEWYKRTEACDNVVLEFIDAWTETLRAYKYKSGVYSSGSAAIKAMDEALANRRRGFSAPHYIWFAWTNGKPNLDAGPYLRDSFFTPHRRMHQYSNGKTVRYGGAKVNIDWNVVDIGWGSVATRRPRPCHVSMDYSSYPRLETGDREPQVATLQCLLRMRGYSTVPIDGRLGGSTAAAVDKFRARLGWGPSNGTVNRETWTSLHALGRNPVSLKRGSVGESVWRLQRALTAAGATVRLNGVYDHLTVNAIAEYRDEHDLPYSQATDRRVWSLLQHGKVL